MPLVDGRHGVHRVRWQRSSLRRDDEDDLGSAVPSTPLLHPEVLSDGRGLRGRDEARQVRQPLSPSGDLTQKHSECGKTARRYKARRTRAHEPGGSCVGRSTGRPDKVRRVAAEGQQRKASSPPVPQLLSVAGGARAVGHTSGTSQARGRDGDGFQITLVETAQVTRQRPTDKLSPEDHSGCDYGRVAPGEAAAVGLPREKCLGRCYDEDKTKDNRAWRRTLATKSPVHQPPGRPAGTPARQRRAAAGQRLLQDGSQRGWSHRECEQGWPFELSRGEAGGLGFSMPTAARH